VRRPSRRLLRLSLFAVVATLALWTGVIALAVSARASLPRLDVSSVRSESDSNLAYVTSWIAGRGTIVYCWSKADWDARLAEYAWRHPGVQLGAWGAYTHDFTINLPPSICLELTKLRRDPTPVWDDESPDALAWSVSVLAHESAHVTGWYDEAVAECYGMQTIAHTAGRLGRTRAEGRWLAERYARRFYPRRPSRYASPECRNGGRLDLHPGTDVWP
jgi:hypothetical protein